MLSTESACFARETRRAFLSACGAGAMLGLARPGWADKPSPKRQPARLRLAVKWGMIEVEGPPIARFQLCRELGYDGMELISPGQPPLDKLQQASAATGMPIHGVVNTRHWQVRLSSPDESVRDTACKVLRQAVQDAASMGADSVLLVPGVVGEEATHAQVWSRSIEGIRTVAPLCAELGVRVLIENVWNGFCETAESFRDYLDEIASPWVGAYLDLGNCRKFGPTEHWVRTLAHRVVKLDVKDWGAETGFGKIGDGDVDWPAVRQALAEIRFSGWCTAEVAGGDRQRLAEIHRRMTAALVG